MLENLSFVAVIVATLLALFATLTQLTSTEKLTRKVGTWRAEAEATPDPYDSHILWSLHRAGTAKLVAIDAVSFKLPVILMTVSIFLVVALLGFGIELGTLSKDQLSWKSCGSQVFPLLIIPGFLAGTIFSVFHTFRARKKMQLLFLERKALLKKLTISEAMPASSRSQAFRWDIILRVMVAISASLFISSLNILIGAMGSSTYESISGSDVLSFISGVVLVSLISSSLLLALLNSETNEGKKKKIEWNHQVLPSESIIIQPSAQARNAYIIFNMKMAFFRHRIMPRKKSSRDRP